MVVDPLLKNVMNIESEEVFNGVQVLNRSCTIYLSSSHLVIAPISQTTTDQVKLSDIIGSQIFRNSKQKTQVLHVYAYETDKSVSCCCFGTPPKLRDRVKKTLELVFERNNHLDNSSESECIRFDRILRHFLSQSERKSELCEIRNKKFLVIVNPMSGTKKGFKVWKNVCKPMLDEAEIRYELLVTQHANHAKNYMLDVNYEQFDAVMSIGGDGIVYEIINGIGSRPNYENIFKALPLAIIPSGTGNGLAKSILFECDEPCTPLNATFTAIKGIKKPLDLSLVTTANNFKIYSFLALSWGFISDVDINTEPMRFLGDARLTLGAVYYMLQSRFYSGTLKVKLLQPNVLEPDVERNLLHQNDFNTNSTDNEWTVITGDFFTIWILLTSHTAMDVLSSPTSRLNDGIMTILLMKRGISRMELLGLILAIEKGEHLTHPGITVVRCSEYILTPQLPQRTNLVVDGELIPYGETSAKMLPSMARVLSLP